MPYIINRGRRAGETYPEAARGGGAGPPLFNNQIAWGWNTNPAIGNDNNIGTPASPLLTQFELVRRLGETLSVGVMIRPVQPGSGVPVNYDDMLRLAQPTLGDGTVVGIWNILADFAPITHLAGPSPGSPGFMWNVLSPGTVPSFSEFYGSEATIWHQQLANIPSVLQCTFGAQPITGGDLGLLADLEPGDIIVPVTSLTDGTNTVVVGSRLFLTDTGQIGNQYWVKNITGAGPFFLQLDRPIKFTIHLATSTVRPIVSTPTGISIDGRGMRITGPGGTWITMSSASDFDIRNIRLDPSLGSPTGGGGIAVDLDTASYRGILHNIRPIDPSANFATSDGLFLAACEDVQVTDSDFSGFANVGLECNFSANCRINRTSFRRNGSDGAQVQGVNNGITFLESNADDNGNNGYTIEGTDVALVRSGADRNVVAGAVFAAATTPVVRPKVIGSTFTHNSTGLSIESGVQDIEVRGTTSVNNVGNNLVTGGGATGTIDVNVSSDIPLATITNITNANPIVVTTRQTLVGAIGTGAQFFISGVTGPGAGSVNGLQGVTITGPNTFSIPTPGTGAASGGTAQQVSFAGIDNSTNMRFLRATVKGNFGSSSAFVNRAAAVDATVDELEIQNLIPQTLLFVEGGGSTLSVVNGAYDSGVTAAHGVTIQSGGKLNLIGRHRSFGAGASTSIGINNAGTCFIGAAVDFSASQSGFRFFNSGLYLRVQSTVAQPWTLQSTPIVVSNATVTLSDPQLGTPVIVLSGTLTAPISLIFPNVPGDWFVDDTAVVYGGNTITPTAGVGTATAWAAVGPLRMVRTAGANAITTGRMVAG